MRTISTELRTHLDGTVTTLATLWKIIRQDGTEFFFTDHDAQIIFNGDTYKADSGYSRTAVESDASFGVDNLEIQGIFSNNEISETEMRAGLFDHAEVFMSIVNWEDLSQGELKVRRGRLGETVMTEQGLFRTELRGLSQQLSQQLLSVYQSECRVDLGSAQCGFPIRPAVLPRSTIVSLGTFYRVSTASPNFSVGNSLVNPQFEQGSLSADISSLTGWTILSGKWGLFDGTNEGLSPDSGSQYLQGGASASGEVRQDVSVLQLGFSSASIDAGDIDADFACRRANSLPDDTGQIIVEFLTSAKVLISTALTTAVEEITPEDTWVSRSFTNSVLPVGTRYVRVRLKHGLVTGGVSNGAFDSLSLGFEDTSVGQPPLTTEEQYENRIYEVTAAGTTAGTQPSYNTAVDADTTDGTATMTARESFMRNAVVLDVIDRRRFTIAVTDPREVDDWYVHGGAIFETGPSAGRTFEIKDYVSTTKTITLYLPTLFDIQAGTKLRLYAGCDKRRTTCRNKLIVPSSRKFLRGNVVNFRGEPDLPGSDELRRTADAR